MPPRLKTISKYIQSAPKPAQKMLRELRAILKSVAPKAKEAIKWGSPVMEEKHINFMPTRSALAPFKKELSKFATGKDTIQLPYGKPVPKALIRKIAAYRAKQVREEGALWMIK